MIKLSVKSLLLATCFALCVLTACDQKPKNPVSEYGDALSGAYKNSKGVAEQANLDAVQKSVDAYRAANEKYPENLNDVEPLLGGSGIDLTKYVYDPQTGKVGLKSIK